MGKKCRHLAKESGANIEESCDNDMVNEGLTVANYCKATCDNCGDDSADPTISPTTCVDLKQSGVKFDYTRFKSDGVTVKKEKTGKKCRHLAKESEANIEESCDNDMVNEGLTVANYCKATCDNCGDDSAAPSISELSSISPLPQPHMMPSSLKTSIPSTNVLPSDVLSNNPSKDLTKLPLQRPIPLPSQILTNIPIAIPTELSSIT